jgi:outer membrane immunogenic protein
MRRHMKLAFAASILLAVGQTGVASAADMAVKTRPVVAPVMYNWSGCYIGGNAGGGWTRMDTSRVLDATGATANADYGRENDSGFIGGGQAGCDFQTGNLVMGVQGQFDFGNVSGRHALRDFPTFSETNNLRTITSGTGRIGYLFTPTLLGYGKVGVAYLNSRNQVFTPGGALFETGSFWQPAILVGGGVEWMFAPNWSVFAEYNYMFTEEDFAHQFTTPGGLQAEVLNVRPRVQTALVGVNYKFHWDGPVVAKY